MKTPKGFASILLLSMVPLVLAGGLLVFTAFSFLKTDLGTLNLCRALQLEVQNKAGKNLDKLLKLNPQALKLRLAQRRAEKSIYMAVQSGNPAAIAAAEAFFLKVQMQRQALHLRQRTLIETTNVSLKMGGATLQRRLLQEWNFHSQPVSSWLQGRLQLAGAKIPELSVKPDFFEVAPMYEPVLQFEEAQAWTQNWHLELKTLSWAEKFLKFHGRFQRSCTTSLYSENATWIAKLKKAKSLWKGFF